MTKTLREQCETIEREVAEVIAHQQRALLLLRDGMEQIEAAGIEATVFGSICGGIPWFKVDRDALPRVRQAFGRMTLACRFANGPDSVGVLVKCADLPGVRFYYTLPYAGNSKCRIVETTESVPAKQTKSYTLVCETEKPS